MGEVTYIIVSEDVFEDPNVGRVISKPYSSLYLPAIPNNFSFSISFGIIDLKYNTDNPVLIQIKSPSGKTLTEQKFNHRLDNNNKGPEVNVTTDLTMYCKNFFFNEEGHYKITVSLDGQGKTLTFPVYKRNESKND
ncbi:hypothetical protein AAHH17_14005 [Lysinibacillus capsici]|uniref:hypothetical protein n=1 Tax=Lysinibacillus capsici TaxID=2115968 RepID=UPI0032E4205E